MQVESSALALGDCCDLAKMIDDVGLSVILLAVHFKGGLWRILGGTRKVHDLSLTERTDHPGGVLRSTNC